MNLENFKNSFEKKNNSDKLLNKILCLSAIFGSLLLAYLVFVNHRSKSLLFVAIWLMILGVYGMIELNKHYKLTYLKNNFSEIQNLENSISVIQVIAKGGYVQNENSFNFIYQKSWWRMDYEVNIFAGEFLIAINAEGRGAPDSGFIDFGVSKKIEQRIMKLLISNASR